MAFYSGAQGYGLSVMLANGEYGTPSTQARSVMTLSKAGTYDLKTIVYFEIRKVASTTTSGTFGTFGGSLHRSAQVKSGGTWSTATSCTATGAVMASSLASGVGTPPSAQVPALVCTLNKGQAINITLPAVEALAMTRLGSLPNEYQKHEYPLHYVCTGTGGVANPTYRIGLVGTKAGSTNALQSSNPNVGVMVEAVDSRGSAPQTLVPGTATSASQVRLYDAGQSGGATMKLLSYPVRSGGTSASDVKPGKFSASGTLRVFTD
ncbi:hypothetical protein QLQ15_13390 [Lysobacter sp. LF1]|uniref:Fimbrial-type adhesion domain-containing protein n=1 Tax=Lysobacter stagni TaxID=3045172 RepID=A0ABT6XJI1_9GAMM|nr:fimbrial protein [Lysobacter sp. LF1]MDI9239900.1 hypothetical protein [Lysobacter sp. LF1]